LHPQDCLVTSSAAMSCTSGVCAGSSAALTAQRASSAVFCLMAVSCGHAYRDSTVPSKVMTAMSSGMRRPRS